MKRILRDSEHIQVADSFLEAKTDDKGLGRFSAEIGKETVSWNYLCLGFS